jgi:DNA polymerase
MHIKKQCKWYLACPIKYFYEDGKLNKKWVDDYCLSDWSKCVRFYKEENNIYHPDNMLPNGEIDENLS